MLRRAAENLNQLHGLAICVALVVMMTIATMTGMRLVDAGADIVLPMIAEVTHK